MKVHERSQMGSDLRLMGAALPETSMDIVESWDDIYLPVNSSSSGGYVNGTVMQFQIEPVGDSYVDLERTYFILSGHWSSTKAAGATYGAFGAPGGANIISENPTGVNSVVAGFPNVGLFGYEKVYFNDTLMTQAKGGDIHIQYLDSLARVKEAGGESDNRGLASLSQYSYSENIDLDCLDTAGFAYDRNFGAIASGNALTPATATNFGAYKRMQRINLDTNYGGFGADGSVGVVNSVQYVYRPSVGAFKDIHKYLPDRVGFRYEGQIMQPKFYNIAADGVTDVLEFLIDSMELVIHRVKPLREIMEQNNALMVSGVPWMHPFTIADYRRHNISGPNIDISQAYNGVSPKVLAVFVQSTVATTEVVTKNALYYDEGAPLTSLTKVNGGVSQLYIIYNGKSIPRRPYQMTNNSKMNKLRAYQDFVQTTRQGLGHSGKSNMLSYLQWSLNSPVYMFWIKPDHDMDNLGLVNSDCTIEVRGNLINTSATGITVHTIGYVDAVVEIHADRSVYVKTHDRRTDMRLE